MASRQFANIDQYVQAAAAPQVSPLDSLILGFQGGQAIRNLPAQLQQSQQDALNNQLLAVLKQAQIRQALTQQGIFVPTAASNGTPASVPAIPLTFEEQRAINPYLPQTPQEVAAQKPVIVPIDIPVQDVRRTIPLGGGAIQAPEIAQQNLNEAIRRAAAQKQNEALSKPVVVDKHLVIPRGTSGQTETLYSPGEPEITPGEKMTAIKEIRAVYDDLPAKVQLFGKGQIIGSNQLKNDLDAILKPIGGDFNKLTPQGAKAFVFRANKLNDPTSATLLSEASQIAERAGIGDRFAAYMQNLKTGKDVSPAVARDIYNIISQVQASHKEQLINSLIPLKGDSDSLNKKLTSIGVPKDIEDEVERRIANPNAVLAPASDLAPKKVGRFLMTVE